MALWWQDIVPLMWMVLFAIFALIVLIGVMSWIRTLRRNRALRESGGASEASLRCRACGYIVEKLDLPRCPECGAAIGFRKSFSELGVSDAELQAHRRKKED